MASGWSTLIGIGCLVGAAFMAKQSLDYRRDGVVVFGTVIAVEAKLSSDDDGFSFSERQRVEYTPVGGAQTLTMQTNWGSALLSTRKPGAVVKVRYLPDAPDKAREDSLLLDWGAPLALVLLGIGGLTGQLRSSGAETVWWRSGGD